ncbi:hypothetical protein [Palleronia pelagia]|uniref:Tetratricopeptide repeat-like domain-containing protein n=1 Tax=Palleronia pelagia TaxID=387096 RepID=A0A1H8BBE4_9RHOB|nr:hypothetical protein [Palleronia pelagia]SEM79434.1 hypothetical protein SAMN04488011_101497 [Palleronia pelagia]
MSNNDSFIDEVSDELRRDRLFGMLRRYGWIAIALVLLLVGGAAVYEYQRAQDRAEAQAFGDALLAALGEDSPEARREALMQIEAEGTRRALIAMLAADRLEGDEARAATRTELDAVAADDSLPALYRELAVLKWAMIAQDTVDAQEVIDRLSPLTIPGAPYRLLALEQQAVARLRAGEADAALSDLQTIIADEAVTRDLRQRARRLIVALGGSLEAA